jgi:CRISPR/Cas system CMR-associated protein Cmr1 (group 7 of RAMP superfamily)
MSAFGMPIMHNGFKVRMVPYKDGNRISERRASPLIVKVIKLNKLFFPIIIVLSGEIAPQGTVGKEEKNNKQWSKAGENNIKQVNYSKVYEFLDLLNKDKPEIIKI